MSSKLWDEYVSYVNAYYAVQEHCDELRRAGAEVGSGLSAFCHDANPFLWDEQSSANPAVYQNFSTAFGERFDSDRSTAEDGLEFCRDWLDRIGARDYEGELLDAFDSVVDSPQTWADAYQPIRDQLDLRARLIERNPQDNPAADLTRVQGIEETTLLTPSSSRRPATTHDEPRSEPTAAVKAERESPLKLVDDVDDVITSIPAPQGARVCKATLSDTDVIASLLALDDPMLAHSLEEFVMHGMQCGTVVELVLRRGDEVTACAGLTFAGFLPTPENPSGVYGFVNGLAARPGHEDDLRPLLEAIEAKTLARGVGELTLLDTSSRSVSLCEDFGFEFEGSRLLKRL